MISTKFYTQISVCQACRGWGTSEFPPINPGRVCAECSGEGVALFQSQKTYSWLAPAFIDYKSRSLIKYKKLFLIFSPFIVIILFLVFVRILLLAF